MTHCTMSWDIEKDNSWDSTAPYSLESGGFKESFQGHVSPALNVDIYIYIYIYTYIHIYIYIYSSSKS